MRSLETLAMLAVCSFMIAAPIAFIALRSTVWAVFTWSF